MNEPIVTQATYNAKLKVKSPAKRATNGIMLLVGLALSLTGIGAIFGIPIFLYGLFASNSIKGAWAGVCPRCEKEIYWAGGNESLQEARFTCPLCNATITFYAGTFRHAPPA